jgi:hypothetical protein
MTNAIALELFMTPDGRLPGFAQRRLDSLIEKKKRHPLTAEEARELAEALAYIDHKSVALLRHTASANRRASTRPRRFKCS